MSKETHTFRLMEREPAEDWRKKRRKYVKKEIIKDVAAIMGDDINYRRLARELNVPVGMVYYHSKRLKG